MIKNSSPQNNETQRLNHTTCLCASSQRLSAAECLQHPWLTKFEDDLLPSLSLYVPEPINELPAEPTLSCDITPSPCSSSSSPLPLEPSAPSLVDDLPEQIATSTEQPPCTEEPETPVCETSWTEEVTSTEVMPEDEEVPAEDSVVEPDGVGDEDEAVTTTTTTTPLSSPCSNDGDGGSEYVRRPNSARTMLSSATRHQLGGLSSERRSNFKRSMDYLARKFSASADLLEVFGDDDLEISGSSRRSSGMSTTSCFFVIDCYLNRKNDFFYSHVDAMYI